MQNRSLIFWSIGIALAGFLFGMDIAIISDGNNVGYPSFPTVNTQYGFPILVAFFGAILGSYISGLTLEKFGRKITLWAIALLYLITSFSFAFRFQGLIFILFRLLPGLCIGATSVALPVYISEMSPAGKRGRSGLIFQANIFFGALVHLFFIGFFSGKAGNSYVLLALIQATPSLLLLFILRFLPESPRWLIRDGQADKALYILGIVHPETIHEEFKKISQSFLSLKGSFSKKSLFSPGFRKPLILSIIFSFFYGVSGINALIYNAPKIFELAGLPADISLQSTLGIGFINLLFTLLAVLFIDSIGRKALMIIGTGGLIICLGLVSISFYNSWFNDWSIPFFLFIYVGFFAFSQGAIIWVFIAEIFPNEVRASGQTFGSVIHWFMAALLTAFLPLFSQKSMAGHMFLFFTFMMCFQLFLIWKIMPETKGKSLEQLSDSLIRN